MSVHHRAFRGSPAWREVRKRVLARDNYECQIRIPGTCEGRATTVDHIHALAEGGAAMDESNLRGACYACNSRLGAQLGSKAMKQKIHRWSRAW